MSIVRQQDRRKKRINKTPYRPKAKFKNVKMYHKN